MRAVSEPISRRVMDAATPCRRCAARRSAMSSPRASLLPEAGARVRLGQNGSGQLFNFEDDSVAAYTLDAAGGGTFTWSYVSPTRRRESSSEDSSDPCRDVQQAGPRVRRRRPEGHPGRRRDRGKGC